MSQYAGKFRAEYHGGGSTIFESPVVAEFQCVFWVIDFGYVDGKVRDILLDAQQDRWRLEVQALNLRGVQPAELRLASL